MKALALALLLFAADAEPPFDPLDSKEMQAVQGSWDAFQQGKHVWTITLEGDRYHAVFTEEEYWYKGRFRMRSEHSPGQIDFLIDECNCSHTETSSKGIFRWAGDKLILVAPHVLSPRPESFVGVNESELYQLTRVQE